MPPTPIFWLFFVFKGIDGIPSGEFLGHAQSFHYLAILMPPAYAAANWMFTFLPSAAAALASVVRVRLGSVSSSSPTGGEGLYQGRDTSASPAVTVFGGVVG